MNKQEAMDVIESISYYEKVNRTPLEDLVNKIYDDLKPVVPKFVAEWIEELKKSHSNLAWVWQVYPNEPKIKKWLDSNTEKFMRAWLDGYEVEKEKKYTVEIPNPVLTDNSDSVTVLMKLYSGVVLTDVVDYIGREQELVYQLTESEIKQDFDFLWQFAKEVDND